MCAQDAKVRCISPHINTNLDRDGRLLTAATMPIWNTMWTTKSAMPAQKLSAGCAADIWGICLTMARDKPPGNGIASTLQPLLLCPKKKKAMKNKYPIEKTEAEWEEQLTAEEYHILRQAGTERPFSGKYNHHDAKGTYVCKGCGTPLYTSTAKFDSGCGWPSYDKSISGAIAYRKDTSLGMLRVEILCAQCGGHQGHVFDDGPTPTGQRYCVNSASIDFVPDKNESD